MTEKTQKVFISYSWTSPSHEDWVIHLAERLISDGIDVVLDKWDLKEGNDMYEFMESMVNSPEVHKVLIILDKKYSEKANARSGGVGTEAQIISPKIYKEVSQEKFIPIVAERDDEGNAFIPTFLESRVYIDLSSDEHFESNYEDLIRNIYNRPSFSKPKLGTAPSYLFEETPVNFKTTSILRSFDSKISKNPKRINSLSRDFLEDLYSNLKDFTISFKIQDVVGVGKLICENINQYTPLRDDFMNYIDKITKSDSEVDVDIIIRFFEKLPLLTIPEDRGSWQTHEYDNYRFIMHELFIYLVLASLKNENYAFLEDILYSSYFIKERFKPGDEANNYGAFYHYIDSIDAYYKQAYSQDFFAMADLILKRVPEHITKEMIVQADLVCHYVGVMNNIEWFPVTYVYGTSSNFEIFYRLTSQRHFEKVKSLFGVSTPQQLKDKLTEFKENDKDPHSIGYFRSHHSVRPIYKLIDIDKIATTR